MVSGTCAGTSGAAPITKFDASAHAVRFACEVKGFDPLAVFRRVTVDDIAMMTRQLATLVGAGIPLVEAVSALIEQVDKEPLKRVLSTVRDRLNEGSSLAKALEAHPKMFPPLYCNMVAAGEASGTLEAVLVRLADFMEGQVKLKGKIVGALEYPAFMALMGVCIVSVMMIVVVPKVSAIFEDFRQALPWYTAREKAARSLWRV